MSLIVQYRTFKADLQGYAEVSFETFRNQLVPLRRRSAWSAADAERVGALTRQGAGRALQRYFGVDHAAAKGVLGAAEIAAEPLAKAELDEHMRALIKSCLAAGWSAARFLAFAVYLNGTMTPGELVAQDRKARQQRAVENNLLFQLAGGPRGGEKKQAPKDDWDDGEAPDDDQFAEMYRAAGPAFKAAVKQHLADAARQARLVAAPSS